MDGAGSPLAAALITVSNATLPVPWWIIAVAVIVFVCLIAKIVALFDERRRLKKEIAILEGEEEKATAPTPDTKMGGSDD